MSGMRLIGGTLAEMVAALREPGVFPNAGQAGTRVRETHISVVFLAGDRAYKLKKPVDLGFLDFRDAAVRRRVAREELRVNRRYAPGVYLGLAPVTLEDGRARIGAVSEDPPPNAEWLVVMRRLPGDRMLDELLRAGRVTGTMIDAVATTVAAFHERAERGPEIARHGSPEAVRRLLLANVKELAPHARALGADGELSRLAARIDAFLTDRRGLIAHRARDGFVRDLHGDLHAGNVCVPAGGDPVLFDGLEFDSALRCGDVAGEVGFLDVDLEARGEPGLGARFVERYVALTGDEELRQLLPLYGCYRALVRAKVTALKGRPADVTARHFEAGCRRAAALVPRGLVVIRGLSATGKSTVARALAARAGLAVHDSDDVRKRLAGLDPLESAAAEPGRGLYDAATTRATYDALLARAARALDRGHAVVVAGTFLNREQREKAVRTARASKAPILFVELRAPVALLESRLAARAGDASDADARVLAWQRERAEPLAPDEGLDALVVESGGLAVGAIVDRVLQRLGTRLLGEAAA